MMTPVLQTIYGPHGNCYEACVASILDIPMDKIPPLVGSDWHKIVQDVATNHGWRASFSVPGQCGERAPGYAICSQLAPDGSVHAVVYHNSRLIHDPSTRPFVREGRDPILLWSSFTKDMPC